MVGYLNITVLSTFQNTKTKKPTKKQKEKKEKKINQHTDASSPISAIFTHHLKKWILREI